MKQTTQKRMLRKANRPKLVYNADLPIMAKKDEIIAAIKNNPVIIVSGETGSGKTTQIPKFCLAAGRGIDGRIGCTQPRRIAATTVARRIAEELGEELGRTVGYKIRFQDRVRPESYIKIMTDGILLAETLSDRRLEQYDTLIIDEAHERSLNIDLILGILTNQLAQRTNLKVVITSATIDTEKFSKAFHDAPIIEVSGRMFPVEIRYDPLDTEMESEGDQTVIEKAVESVRSLLSERGRGDLLVFMPTEQDIRETCDLIRAEAFRHVTVMPLYSRLSAKEQGHVFSRPTGRKVIVATNIAETSITIPGIRYVVDTGLARIPQYTPRSRITSLPIRPVSRSSADQRKGRCGRVENGICVRLYSEEDYLSRPLFTEPEILRANLAEVILRMLALRLDDISAFPFIDRPAAKSIKDGFELLMELGAVRRRLKETGRFVLTEIGSLMAKLPLDPRLSRMLISAHQEGCIQEVAVIAAALSIQDPRERPQEDAGKADQAHAVFVDPASDFVTLLNIWKKYHETLDIEKTAASLKRFCKSHFLSYRRMREWRDIHAQITVILGEYDLQKLSRRTVKNKKKPVFSAHEKKKKAPTDAPFGSLYRAVHRSVLSGFLSNIAVKKEKNVFRAAKGREVMIFPGSALFNKAGNWVVAAEMVQTSRLFARTVATIDCGWLEALGEDQCKYTYLHPRWERRRGEVVATEQVSLFGLIIVSDRTIGYGRIHPGEASEIFIRAALVEGDVRRPFAFMGHNQQISDEIMEMENKLRRRDLFAGEESMFRFYREKLSGVYDTRTLEKRIKEKGGDGFLRMRKEDLLVYPPDENELSLFPDSVALGNNKFGSIYRFDPGDPADGLTVNIPATLSHAVSPESIDWLVPGFLAEKITTLVKGLPKQYRKKLVPVAETVAVIMAEMPRRSGTLPAALSRFIVDRFGVDIPAAAWPLKELPDYLRMRISLAGPGGEALLAGRDPAILRQDMIRISDPNFFRTVNSDYEKKGLKRWDFGDLPEAMEFIDNNKTTWEFYPGLAKNGDEEGGVNLRLFPSRETAMASHLQGVAALYGIYLLKELKYLKKILKIPSRLKPAADYFGGLKKLERRLYGSVMNDSFCRNIRTANDFEYHARLMLPQIQAKGQEKLDAALTVLDAVHSVRTIIFSLEQAHRSNTAAFVFLDGLRRELSRLVPETFLDLYGNDRLIQIVRYVRTISIRAQKGLADLAKDQKRAAELSVYQAKLEGLLSSLSPATSTERRKAVEDFFWSMEEYKVSLFAQELKTLTPVSPKRLDAKLREIERLA
ncbi:MAG: ATP-dependent RNA helicase HrpA [Desulfobacterales bacterium]|nr:ATP-dependent RNA helicase HrpA [Desulfobacterales bacterium]